MGNQGTDESELTGYTISLLDENGEILTEKEALSLGISRKKQPPWLEKRKLNALC